MINRTGEYFTLENLIDQARVETNQKIDNAKSCFDLVKIKPEHILTMFEGKGSYNETTDVVKLFGDKFTVHDMQSYLYSILIPFLRAELDNEFDYTYSKNQYSSTISLGFDGYSIGYLDIFRNNLRLFNALNIQTREEGISFNEEKIENLSNTLQYLKTTKDEPLKACKGLKDLIVYIFKNKQLNEGIDNGIKKIEREIAYYEGIFNDEKERLEKDIKYKPTIEDKTKKVVNFFEGYGYEVH